MEYTGLEIAVIGISCRFPGAENKEQFWNNLLNGHESVTFFTDEELLKSGVPIEQINNPNYVKANNVLKDSKCFDASFFGYTPKEALLMDPQTRVFHETVWNALEDAGYVPDEYKGRIGLYSGSSPNFLWEGKVYLSGKGQQFGHFGSLQLCDKDFMPTRISYSLDLRGPSMAIYTACSTSLVSVHLACRGLLNGDCNMAVAGGVTIFDQPNQGYLFQEGMIYSPDGHCRAFDKDAAGTLGGEGAGAVVLKRLQNAINDNDPIYAVIKSTAINNDGRRKAGYTAPGSSGQADVIKLAHSLAKIKSEDISFVETHGTGTNIGDPIEIDGLRKAFNTEKKGYCAIGALKTNIGHLDSASGVAGLIKTVLVLKNKKIPPTLHFKEPNPNLGLGESPFYINTGVIDLKSSNEAPAIAGVSSFGIGGTNAHAVLQEYNRQVSISSLKPSHLILLSAKSPSALHNKIKQLHEYLLNNEKASIADIAFTLQTGRASMPYQTQFICSDANDLKEKLASYSLDPKKISISKNRMEIGNLIFAFSGQGSQYINMGIGLYTHEAVFKKELDNCFGILKQITNIEFKNILYPQDNIDEAVAKINEFTYTSPIKFSFDYSLAKYMMSIGVVPKAMVGHSFGEYTVACLAGVMSLQEALELVVLRGRLMHSLPDGAMLSVPLSESEIIKRINENLSLAAVNSASQCIVSGAPNHVKEFKDKLEKEGIDSVILRVPRAGHSYMVDAILDEFEQKVKSIKFNSPQMPYVSGLTGNWIGPDEVKSSKYWTRHLRETVRFNDATTELLKLDNPIFIQVGSDRSLESFIRQNKSGSELVNILNLIKHPKDEINDYYFFLERLGKLWTLNVKVDWVGYYNEEKRSRLNLPAYPFDRHKYDINYDIAQRSGQSIESLADDEGFGSDENYETLLLDSEYVAPSNQTEQQLAEIWCNLLGYKKIGVNDNFFELGGDSLKATLMSSEIYKQFNVRLSIKTIIKEASIKQIALSIQNNKTDIYSKIKQAEHCEYYDLSSAQKRLYFLQNFAPENTAYNVPQVFSIKGKINLEKFQLIFEHLIRRHESFRTKFIMMNDKPVQVIEDGVDFKIDFKQINKDNLNTELLKEIKPFKLDVAPLLRVSLLQLTQDEYMLFSDMHHIIGDGFSNSILYKEFIDLLQDKDLVELKLQYKDFSNWQNSSDYGEMISDQKKFWLEKLENVPILQLPYDIQRSTVQGTAGETIAFEIDSDIYTSLKKLEASNSFTLFNICVSAYYILLYKLSNQNDIVVGTSVFGRKHQDFENIIGMFVNTVPLRNFPENEKTLISFIEEVQDNNLNYFENQDYQYEEIVKDLVSGYDTSRNSIFDVFFSFLVDGTNNVYQIPLELDIQSYEVPKITSMFDLTLSGHTAGEKLIFYLEYSTELFKKETIERYINYYKKILSTISQNANKKIADIEIFEKNYWLNKFGDDFKKTTIPADFFNSSSINKDKYHDFSIPVDISLAIQRLGNNSDRGINEILSASLVLILSELNQNRKRIVLGTPIYINDENTLPTNTVVPLIVDLSGVNNFKSLINSISDGLKEVIGNSVYSITDFPDLLNLEFKKSELFPIFDIGVVYDGLQDKEHLDAYNYSILFAFSRTTDKINVSINYNSSLYNENSIKQIEEIFLTTINGLIQNINEDIFKVEIIPSKQKESILKAFNSNKVEFNKNISIHDTFLQQVKKSNDSVALVMNDSCITYGLLNEKSDLLSKYLKANGVRNNSLVGLICERSFDLFIGILGILKSGAGYLAIDINTPENRIKYMISDSGVNLVLGHSKYFSKIENDIEKINITEIENNFIESKDDKLDYSVNDIAYVLYTSGTTGFPKGVVTEHKNVIAYCNAFLNEFNFNSSDIILQQASHSFDTFVEEVFPMLFSGGRIVIANADVVKDIPHLAKYIIRNSVSIIDSTPLLINELGKISLLSRNLKTIISGGDVLKGEYLNGFYENATCYNTYGPTESTVCASFYRCSQQIAGDIPIGKSIANYTIYILNQNKKLVPIGYKGEISIGGDGVARGYLNNVELTNEKFISNPYNKDERLYRSGDVGKYSNDGIVNFCGRTDNQVSIRGYRIELNEIENQILRHPEIKEVVVVPVEKDNETLICAYVVTEMKDIEKQLQNYLRSRVPEYMIPSFIVKINKLPVNSNGKVSVKLLPSPYGTFESAITFIDNNALANAKANMGNKSKAIKKDNAIQTQKIEISNEERDKLLFEFNKTSHEFNRQKHIAELFEEQVFKTPDRIAVVFNDTNFTYTQLNSYADSLAVKLVECGIQPNTIVGILAQRSFNLIVGVIAILKSGGAFMPMEEEAPDERLKYIISNTTPELVLVDDKNSSRDLNIKTINISEFNYSNYSVQSKQIDRSSENITHVLHTSGSTGRPKGVLINNYSVINLMNYVSDILKMDETFNVLSLTSVTFDLFSSETLLPLIKGAKVNVFDTGGSLNIKQILTVIEKDNTTFLQCSPTTLQKLALDNESSKNLRRLKHIISAGEPLLESIKEKFSNVTKTTLYNLYGPTETTLYSTGKNVTGLNSLNIGKPVYNTEIRILDGSENLIPIAAEGELFIGGEGLARGYVNQPEMTHDSFRIIDSKRFYKTGDLAKWCSDGDIDFIGRIDNQIQLAGIRVEPSEIENTILTHPDISEAAVIVKNDDEGNKYLMTCLVADRRISETEIRGFLTDLLPVYLIPRKFVQLESMPYTASKKIYRKLLESLHVSQDDSVYYEAPRSDVEIKLTEIWAEVLNIPKESISIKKSFFSIGGHSLKAISLVSKIQTLFGVEISLIEVFSNTTIEELAIIIEKLKLNKVNEVSEDVEFENVRI